MREGGNEIVNEIGIFYTFFTIAFNEQEISYTVYNDYDTAISGIAYTLTPTPTYSNSVASITYNIELTQGTGDIYPLKMEVTDFTTNPPTFTVESNGSSSGQY